MPHPLPVPIGLHLSQAARAVSRAFDDALAEAGGSLPVWLILLNLKVRRPGTQRELAEAVGIREATLTHHLNAMDTGGLITRTRDSANRRVQLVALTPDGDAAFAALRDVAMAFDARLSTGLTDADKATLAGLLDRLTANIGGPGATGPVVLPPGHDGHDPHVSGTRGSAAPPPAGGTAAAAGRAGR